MLSFLFKDRMAVQTYSLALVYDLHCLSHNGLYLGNTHKPHQFSRRQQSSHSQSRGLRRGDRAKKIK